MGSKGLVFRFLLHGFLAHAIDHIRGNNTDFLAQQQAFFRAQDGYVRGQSGMALVIENRCAEDILIRNHLTLASQGRNSQGDGCENPANCLTLRPNEVQTYPWNAAGGTFIAVLSWAENRLACMDGTFCQQLEFQPGWQSNFANQRGFSMPVGVAYRNSGQVVGSCPEPTFAHCQMEKGRCKSNAGGYDICRFDPERDCPKDHAHLVKIGPNSRNWYCVSPDLNRAVISHDMDNPTKEHCKRRPSWKCGVHEDEFHCKNICAPRDDLKHFLRQHSSLFGPDGNQIEEGDLLNPPFSAGGKIYQEAVNRACGNQPPTQKLASTDTDGGLKLQSAPSDRFKHPDMIVQKEYLDHAISYEGDDTNIWKWGHQTVLMAGNVGVVCSAPFNEYHVVACPL